MIHTNSWEDLQEHTVTKAEWWNTSPQAVLGGSALCHSRLCIWCKYNSGLASSEVLNFQPGRICERSRSFGSFVVAVVLVEHPAENTQLVLGCLESARLAQSQSLSFPPPGWLSWDTWTSRRVC